MNQYLISTYISIKANKTLLSVWHFHVFPLLTLKLLQHIGSILLSLADLIAEVSFNIIVLPHNIKRLEG